MSREALAFLGALVAVACATPTPVAAPVPDEPRAAADGTTTRTAEPPPASASASVPPASVPPPPEKSQARRDAELACKQRHCFKLGKHCFDACYKYNHPRNPEGHVRCNESCRRSYRVEPCEASCEEAPEKTPKDG